MSRVPYWGPMGRDLLRLARVDLGEAAPPAHVRDEEALGVAADRLAPDADHTDVRDIEGNRERLDALGDGVATARHGPLAQRRADELVVVAARARNIRA